MLSEEKNFLFFFFFFFYQIPTVPLRRPNPSAGAAVPHPETQHPHGGVRDAEDPPVDRPGGQGGHHPPCGAHLHQTPLGGRGTSFSP